MSTRFEKFSGDYYGVYAQDDFLTDGPIAMFRRLPEAAAFTETVGCSTVILKTAVDGMFDNSGEDQMPEVKR